MREPGGRSAPGPSAGRGEPRAPGDADVDEPPPVLGRWSRLYLLVVLELVAVIAILLWLTRRFA